ncbi:MAG: HD family hydrolase, partial [Pseudomonadota bacterium]
MTIRKPLRKPPARVWQRMLSGRRLDLMDPSPVDVEVEDIAHGLARVARWNGQTKGAHAFSVAQHSVIVEALCVQLEPRLDPRSRLLALLHDAPEYVIGDMISPFKAVLGDGYKDIESRLAYAIHARFGLPAENPASWVASNHAQILSAFLIRRFKLAGVSAGKPNRAWMAYARRNS